MATPVQFSNSDGATKRQCRMLKVNLGRENAQSKEQLQVNFVGKNACIVTVQI